ncbi:MAG: hypothetical protein WBW92_03425 [Rhodanobacteraceae bacterium]
MKFSTILILASLPLLASCHRDTRPEWQQAEAAPHLKIPGGIDTPGRSAEMVVPAASGRVEGTVHDDTTPPTSMSLVSDSDIDGAWQVVTGKLTGARIGAIVSRDDDQHHLGLKIKGSELPQPESGFFSWIFHNGPDPARKYYASIGVISQNGETMVNIDGDGPAVLHLGSMLEGKSLKPVAQKGGDVSRAAPRRIQFQQSSGMDASGKPPQ